VNVVYLERAARALRGNLHAADDVLLQYLLSPLGWGHINLTGGYLWLTTPSEVQVPTATATSLAYDFFRFLKRHHDRGTSTPIAVPAQA
jgi:hypothetical protein